MPRPADPAAIAPSSAATSSWANSVVDANVAILDDIYAAVDLAIPWSSLTGLPATFTPTTAATVDAETSYSQASTAGVAATASRSDHSHGTPALPTPAALNVPTTYTTPAT